MATQSLVQPPRTANPSDLYEALFRLIEDYNRQITTGKIADSAITSAKILDATIATADLAADSVTPAKLLLGQTSNDVVTEQNTTSTTYTDLATVGPTLTISPTASQQVLVIYGTGMNNSAVGFTTYAALDVSGATTRTAADTNAIFLRPTGTNGQERVFSTKAELLTLNSGSNTLTLKYRVEGNTGTYSNRFLIAIPLS